jgi:hypothetical protein
MPSTDQTSRIGVNAVTTLFTNMGWAVREQPTSDFGVDAQAEKLGPEGSGTGRLIALQIKSGASWFKKRGENYVYYGSKRHLQYWLAHSLPVYIVLHNPDTGLTIWQKMEQHLITEGVNGAWSIEIPAAQTLTQDNDQFIASGAAMDLSSLRRIRLVLDLEYIRTFAVEENIFMLIDVWVNKTLNYRGAEFVFNEEPDAGVDYQIDAMMPCYTVEYYMAVAFPWLDWEMQEYIDESEGAYEVAQYILKVEVNEVGKAALRLETYFASELPPFLPEPSSIVDYGDWSDAYDGETELDEEEPISDQM